MIFHISHGAMKSGDPKDVDWFLVEPLDGETKKVPGGTLTHVDEVNSLINARRTVYELDTETMSCAIINKGRFHNG